MWKALWSILTLKFLTRFINNKIELMLTRKELKRATMLYSLGTLFKLALVLFAIYYIMNNSQDESRFIYYVTIAEEIAAIVLCALILFGNYLKLQKGYKTLVKSDT